MVDACGPAARRKNRKNERDQWHDNGMAHPNEQRFDLVVDAGSGGLAAAKRAAAHGASVAVVEGSQVGAPA